MWKLFSSFRTCCLKDLSAAFHFVLSKKTNKMSVMVGFYSRQSTKTKNLMATTPVLTMIQMLVILDG